MIFLLSLVSDSDFDHVRQEAQQFRPLERCKKDIMSHRVTRRLFFQLEFDPTKG
jgi:hypothetical protein